MFILSFVIDSHTRRAGKEQEKKDLDDKKAAEEAVRIAQRADEEENRLRIEEALRNVSVPKLRCALCRSM